MYNATSSIAILRNKLAFRTPAEKAVESLVLLTINIAALVGNAMVCVIFYRNSRLRTATNFHIISLAISDVVMATVGMPLVVYVLIVGEWRFPSAVCSIHGFLVLSLSFISLEIVTLTAVNRYFRITRGGLAFPRWLSKKWTVASLVASVPIAALLVGFPLIAGWGRFTYHPGKVTCVLSLYRRTTDLAYSCLLGLLLVIMPFTVITFCYSKVHQKVQKHRRSFSATSSYSRSEATGSGPSASNSSRLSVEEINITTTLFAIVIGFTFCWIPVISIEFAESLLGNFSLSRPVYLLYVCLVGLSAAINPIIYGIMNRRFRVEYSKLFCSAERFKVKLPRRKKTDSFDSRL